MSLERWRAEPIHEAPDFAEELLVMAAEIDIPAGAIGEKDIAFATTLLERVREDHGDPTKDTYKHHHNENHAINHVKCFWMLWKPLWERFPGQFDIEGFKVGMFIGAGHDLKINRGLTIEKPGQNERESAELVRDMMLEAAYEESLVQRVHNGIIKTTVEFIDGIPVQTEMRQGSKDMVGLVAGQADMDPVLIEGPSIVFEQAFDVWLENTNTPIKDALGNPAGITSFMAEDEKSYFDSRVAVLSDDLKYYVEDPERRAAIIQTYRDSFEEASRGSLAIIDTFHSRPEIAKRMIDESFKVASRVAHRGLGQIVTAKRHMAEQIRRGLHNED